MRLLEQHGFRAVTLEGIAEEAGVARTTVYRRWPNKAAVVMDAFLTQVAPGIAFPEHPIAVERLRLQMQLLARAFRQGPGLLIRALIAEAQFDEELRDNRGESKRSVSTSGRTLTAYLQGRLAMNSFIRWDTSLPSANKPRLQHARVGHIGHHRVSVWNSEGKEGVSDGRRIIKRGSRRNSFR